MPVGPLKPTTRTASVLPASLPSTDSNLSTYSLCDIILASTSAQAVRRSRIMAVPPSWREAQDIFIRERPRALFYEGLPRPLLGLMGSHLRMSEFPLQAASRGWRLYSAVAVIADE